MFSVNDLPEPPKGLLPHDAFHLKRCINSGQKDVQEYRKNSLAASPPNHPPNCRLRIASTFRVSRPVEIQLRGPDMAMPHQRLDGFEVVPVVQKGRGKRMPHDVGMDPLRDQCLLYHGFYETVNTFSSQPPFQVGTMPPQGLGRGDEHDKRQRRVSPQPGGEGFRNDRRRPDIFQSSNGAS